MSDMMTFPDTVEDFMEQYKIVDTKQVYTNGAELVPIFRMKQWFEHLQAIEPERKTGRWIEQDDAWDGVYYECSSCGEPWTLIDGTPWDNGMNFCPNCGARMMEGEG